MRALEESRQQAGIGGSDTRAVDASGGGIDLLAGSVGTCREPGGCCAPVGQAQAGADERSSQMETMTGDQCVFHSPTDGHCAVARPGEGGTQGWPKLYGPNTSQACWDWIRANCTGGPNYYQC